MASLDNHMKVKVVRGVDDRTMKMQILTFFWQKNLLKVLYLFILSFLEQWRLKVIISANVNG